MDAERRRLVQESWEALAPDHDQVATTFYDRLFEIDPHARALFEATDMAGQRAKVIVMLGDIAHNLDHLEEFIPTVSALGRRHHEYGVHDADYDRVREALLGAIASALGPRMTPEARSAWEEAYALTASVMKRAGHARESATRR